MRIEVSDNQRAVECAQEDVRRVVETVLREEGRDAELSIALVEDRQMRELNRRFLRREGTTDVLAFPYGSDEGTVSGEIVANAELAAREAAVRPHGPDDELMLYIVHGLLHLLGYDDHDAEQAGRMHERERELLAAAGRRVEV